MGQYAYKLFAPSAEAHFIQHRQREKLDILELESEQLTSGTGLFQRISIGFVLPSPGHKIFRIWSRSRQNRGMKKTHNKRMQPDFGKLRSPQPLMRGVMGHLRAR
jgi:hypothetical protein